MNIFFAARKYKFVFFVIGFLGVLYGCKEYRPVEQTVFGNETMEALPAPKIESFSSSYIAISKKANLIKDDSFYVRFKAAFDSLQKTIQISGQDEEQEQIIHFSKILDFSLIDQKYKSELSRPESYMLTIGVDEISVMSRDDQGLLNGLSTLEALIEKYKGTLPQGLIVDYPDTNMRVLHLSLWPCSVEDFKEAIKLARFGHYNALILLDLYGANLKSIDSLSKNKNRWNIAEFQEMVEFVKQNGMEVIPSLALLSHQEFFLGNAHPEYMYNKETYDPRSKGLYENVVFPAIDELIALTGATKFHIGHDEVVGWIKDHFNKNILRTNEKQLPPELFLQDILTLNNYLRKKGIETWMWGDMLLSKEEFPTMEKSGANVHGQNGYAAFRTKVPGNIVICDWHYKGAQKSFPTALTFANEGHKVLGATWKFKETTINFARYMYKLHDNVEGMVATTWFGLTGNKKKEVFDIIKVSADAFWNAKKK